MSTERGCIVAPPPQKEWRDSHYSREADRIAARQAREMRDTEQLTRLNRRYAHLHTHKHLTNPDHYDPSRSASGAPLRIAPRYTGERPR